MKITNVQHLRDKVPDREKIQEQFTCDAGSRAYRTYIPVSATREVAGIVVMLHGCTQTAEDFAIGTGMNALAEEHGFVVIYPQQSRGDNARSCWNKPSKPTTAAARPADPSIAGSRPGLTARWGLSIGW